MKSAIFFFALLAAPTVSLGSPVEQVVNLLSELKGQAEADGKAEEQIYNKYACWCETTAKRKADTINEANLDLRALGQMILKLKGKVAVRTAEIAELKEKIADAKDEMEMATAVREKEHASYDAETSETMQALAALEKAVGILVKGSSGASAMLQIEAKQRQEAVKTAIEKMPTKANVKPADLALLSKFTKSDSRYAPQSATIQGILGDMYTTFSANVESSTFDEATAQTKFEKLIDDLETSIAEWKEVKAKKETEKAQAESDLADTTKSYDDTEAEKKAAIEFFDNTKEACTAKNKEWETRVDMRDAELEGIKKALEILTSDKARELFAKSIKPGVEAASFLQVRSAPGALLQSDSTAPAMKAYEALKQVIRTKKGSNLRLAAIAVSIRTAKFGHFEKVISAIDDVIQALKDEEAADIEKKDECKTEYQKIATTVADLDWKIKNNLATIKKLEEKIAAAEEEKAATIQQISDTEDEMKKMTDERKAENAAFKKAKKEDEDAIALLEDASKALAKFYKENDIKMGKIQGDAKSMLQDEPEFKRSEDDAPDATFSDKGARKNQSKNILSILAYITEDLYDEITAGKKDEEKSQLDYEASMKAAQQLVDDLTDKKENLEDSIASMGDDKKDEKKAMDGNNADRDSELKYEDKIKPDCDWIIGAFTKRAEARAAEMSGLVSAKEFLAGQASFVEKGNKGEKKFDDSAFPKLGFLSLK